MTDDWRARAVPAVYPSRRTELIELDAKVEAAQDAAAREAYRQNMRPAQPSRMVGLSEQVDPSDWERPAKAQPPSPLHGIPASIYADMRALQCLVEKAPLAAWRIDGLRLPSVANLREHHHAKAARNKKQRALAHDTAAYWLGADGRTRLRYDMTLAVLLVRVSPRPLDSDNLASACKAVRDGIADALGVDDRDPRVSWVYGQEKGPHALRVLVVEGPTR